MRRFILATGVLLFAGLIGDQDAIGQTWTRSQAPYQRHLNDVQIVGADNIVLAGGNLANDAIWSNFSSFNAGLSWDIDQDVLHPWAKACFFYGDSIGVTVGAEGGIKRTTNGGTDWTDILSPTQQDLNDVFFVSPSVGYAVGGIFGLEDTSQVVLKSNNGGQSWSVLLNQLGLPLESICFSNPDNAVAVGSGGTILRSINAGQDWTTVNPPIVRDFNKVTFTSPTTGYAVGGKMTNDSIRTILKTVDAGASWSVLLDEAGGWLKGIDFVDQNTGYAVGGWNTVLKTVNAGAAWNTVVLPQTTGLEKYNAVDFVAADFGLIVGNSGVTYIFHNYSPPEVQTLPAIVQPSETEIQFQGLVNTQGVSGHYSFKFDTDPNLTFASEYLPSNFNSSELEFVERLGTFFDPGTTYYYCAKASTIGGVVHGDTLAVTTTLPFIELSLDNIMDQLTAMPTFEGTVSGFTEEAQLFFEYGPSVLLGTEVSAVPSIISDGNTYNPSYTFGSPLSSGLYYVRLKAVTAGETYYSGYEVFYNGHPWTTFELQNVHYDIVTGVATFEGLIDGLEIPGTNILFTYGNQVDFGDTIGNPSSINDDLPHSITATVPDLLPGQTYVVSMHFSSNYGHFISNSLNLYTGVDYENFETRTATQITPTSAILHGFVSELDYTSDIEFEYGPTTQLGFSLAADPDQIQDPQEHYITGQLEGLIPNTRYYYRLKGDASGISFHGRTRQFYTGPPEIPNWDFQNWVERSVELPEGWNVMEKSMERIDLGSGNSALKLFSGNGALMGYYIDTEDGPPNFEGVTEFQYRPDSVHLRMDYYVEPDDTATVLIKMDSADVTVAFNLLPIVGSSDGSYVDLAFPLEYTSPETPDRITIVLFTFNLEGEDDPTGISDNYLAVDSIYFDPGIPQIPAATFDQWIPYEYSELIDWGYFKFLDVVSGNLNAPPFVYPVTYGPNGDSAAVLKSKMSFGNVLKAEMIVGGSAVEDGGFHINWNHEVLTGYLQFDRQGTDTLKLELNFLGNGEYGGYSQLIVTESFPELTPFEIPISLDSFPTIPTVDSADLRIVILNSDGISISEAIIDKLCFDGFYVGQIDSVPNGIQVEEQPHRIVAYPNPTTGELNLSGIRSDSRVELWSLDGKLIKTREANSQATRMNLQGNAKGIYLLRIIHPEEQISQRIVLIGGLP